jgi:hypothetical protein
LFRFLRDNRIATLCSDLYQNAPTSGDKFGEREKEFTDFPLRSVAFTSTILVKLITAHYLSNCIQIVQKIQKVRTKFNLRPEVCLSLHRFSRNSTPINGRDMETSCTEFHPNRSANVEITGKNSFTLLKYTHCVDFHEIPTCSTTLRKEVPRRIS